MRDFLRFDPQKWIPESALNIISRLELTKAVQSAAVPLNPPLPKYAA
jgi:hypothetical protein